MTNLVLILDQSGNPQRWSSWEEVAISKAKNLIAWEIGSLTDHFGGVNRLSGQRSSMAIPTIVAIKGVYKKNRQVVALNNRALFGRDQHLCAYCGKSFQHNLLTRDHINPISRGGANTWNNCVTACKRCNNLKDDKLLTEINMSLLFVPYVPCANEALILSNRKVLSDQMEYLAAKLPAHSRVRLS